ncbi:MAG TPA: ActD-like protein, partial [Polyangia bacterium]|nr:ActD-like protein [Polyangia bacterium]
GEVRLPSAYQLDDAPAFERFFLVRAEAPFEVAPVVAAARALAARTDEARRAPLPLPAGFDQVSLTLEKTR